MKRTLLTYSFLALALNCFSQSNEIIAKSTFLKAQELYGNGQYQQAVTKLEEVVTLLGGSNPRVDHLRANCYFQLKNAQKTKEAISSYFDSAVESDPNYMSMLTLLDDFRQAEAVMKLEQENLEKEKSDWQVVKAAHTSEKYEAFLEKYPNGQFSALALSNLNSIPTADLVDNRDGNVYKTIRIGSYVMMAEDLRFDAKHPPLSDAIYGAKPGASLNKKTGNVRYPQYMVINEYKRPFLKICPDGWHVPTSDEIFQMYRESYPSLSFDWSKANHAGGFQYDEIVLLQKFPFLGINIQPNFDSNTMLFLADYGIIEWKMDSGNPAFPYRLILSKGLKWDDYTKYPCRCVKD